MRYVAIIMALAATFAMGDWVMEPEGFEDGVIFIVGSSGSPLYWFSPDYHAPMFVYSPGFESDSAVGSGAMSWPGWWGNFIRTPLQDCSSADSVVLSFRMWNTADPSDNDYARFYVWIEPGGYAGPVAIPMGSDDGRDWELMNIDFTEYAAGQSQVYFYLEANFGTGSFTRECKFDDIGVASSTVLDVEEERDLPEDFALAAYPNPFNGAVTIAVEGAGISNTPPRVEIYDVSGRRVATVTEPDEVPVGEHLRVLPNDDETENGRAHRPSPTQDVAIWHPDESLPSGVYLIRASADGRGDLDPTRRMATKRVVYLK